MILLAALLGLAHADDLSVLVTPLQPASLDAAGISTLLHAYMEDAVDREPDVGVVPVSDAGVVFEMKAPLYLSSCPPGEMIGCALVLAEANQIPYAITGAIQVSDSGSHATVTVLDVARLRQVTLEQDLSGDDAALVDATLAALRALARDEVGAPIDERFRVRKTDAQVQDEEARAAERDALAATRSQAGQFEEREALEVEQRRYTEADLQARMEEEGRKPWERLGLTPRQYMRYKNSGLPLYTWKQLAAGRKGQLVLRPALGFQRGPSDTTYYGRYVRAAENPTQIVQTYAWQAVTSSSGVTVQGTVAWGLSPLLEVGLTGGIAPGTYTVDIEVMTEGDELREGDPTAYPAQNIVFGPHLQAAFLPASKVRPVLGGELLLWRGSAVTSHAIPPSELAVFDAPSMVVAQAVPGVEVRLSPHLDGWLHVPVSAVVFGGEVQRQDEGGDYLPSRVEPAALAPVGAGLLVGFQVRLFGAKVSTERDLEDLDDL